MTPAAEAARPETRRCRWAIRYGVTLATRCDRPAGHGTAGEPGYSGHEGPGLPEFPYQRIEWFAGDQRAFLTDRDDMASWEEEPA